MFESWWAAHKFEFIVSGIILTVYIVGTLIWLAWRKYK